MKRNASIILLNIILIFLFPFSAFAVMGDVDGNGVVDMEDARTIARYVVHQIPAIPNPTDADANQDGKIDMEDAFIIAKKVSGQTRIVVVAPLNGSSNILRQGAIIRIEVFEKFFPFNITGGTVRIHSASTGYDSGDLPLTFERDGRSLYYHWNTTGLTVASDYAITVNLSGPGASALKAAKSSSNILQAASQPDAVASLSNEIFKPGFLAKVVDAFCPAPGMPLEFRRHVPNNAPAYPYLGPLGRGWFHSYDFKLEEFTDGRVALRSRIFQSNSDGTYQSAPGDYGVLTRNPDGTFQLKEKNGFIYLFRSDLRLDYEQDLNGNRITAIYDSSNNLAEIRHSSGKSFYLEYNAAGRLIKLTDHAGRITTYAYDSTNLMLTKVTDPAGNVTEYSYIMGTPYILALQLVCVGTCQPNILDYRLQSILFPDGTRVQNEFDSQARLTRQTGAWGANPITYSYDADGTVHVTDALGATTTVKVNSISQPLQVTTPDGAQTSYQYDASLNLTRASDPLSQVTQFSYDGFGNVTQITNPLSQAVQFGYDLRFNKPSWITNPLGKTTSFTYDSKGNLTTTTYPDASSEGYDYDSAGNLISNTDAAGKMTQYSYNNQGQMTTLQNALGNITQFSYSNAGDLQNVIDARGNSVSHSHDILGQLTRRTYPDGSHEDYEYDGAGKVTAFTNRRGEMIPFAYDVTGRLEWKTYPSGKKLHFLYDPAGYLVSVEQVSGTTTTLDTAYERDTLHRITKAKVPGKVYPESYDVSYAYDAAGNRTVMAYPDGYVQNYAYDGANRLTRISDGSNSTIVSYEYDAAGRRTKRTLGNGTYTTYQYDDLDRLTTLINYSPGGAVQSRFAYTYNKAGIRTSMTTLEGVHNYTYDNTYQLTGVSYPDSRTVNYDFDEVGNRKSVTDNGALTIYSSNALDQFTQTGSESFSYDMDGNLTSRILGSNSTTYGWDEDDRLVSVDRNGAHIDYRYDYQGRLVAKTIGGQQMRYIWDDVNLVAEVDSTGTVIKRYVFGASIDEVIVVTANGTNSWVQLDGLGSAVGITDDGGTIVGTGYYDVYGNPRSGTLRRFAGMRWDEDAGLYYVRARWYEPKIGRFLSPDPLNTSQFGNTYQYARNNPTTFIDTLGLWWYKYDQRTNRVDYWHEIYGVGYIDLNGSTTYTIGGRQVEIGTLFPLLSNIPGRHLSGLTLGITSGPIYIGFTPTIFGNQPIAHEWAHAFGLIANGSTSEAEAIKFADYWAKNYGNSAFDPYKAFEIFKSGVWMCPTFVQGGNVREEKAYNPNNHLAASLKTPWPDSLLRSDIPIYGIASGKDFSRYRIEYGKGANPAIWHLIEETTKAQDKSPDFKDISWMQGDLDLRGNLATWNTGLKNWAHLPWHPQEDQTDLNGIYTLRLTVFGKNGEKAEDKITVEVGRAIAQCLPGIAISPDKRVVMRFPEQALTHPFRIYTLLDLLDTGEKNLPLCKGCEVIGPVYRIREPGDRFIKDVSLDFNVSAEELERHKPENTGIAHYDTVRDKWIWLETTFDKKSSIFSTKLSELPSPKAIYALIYNAERKSSSVPALLAPPAPLKPIRPGVLVDNTFENDLGTFKQRDRIVGAVLSRDNKATPDGSYCLKLTNENHGGNFSSTIIDQPFDVREYGTMTFDYQIDMGVKIDFFLKVKGRWYNLRFTGDAVDYRNKDVNIANLGAIPNIIADNKWHTDSVDLRYLLSRQTRHTRIDEIVMANWNVGGYMKLEFGSNPRGATYYIDNFKITGPGKVENSPVFLMVDDFNLAQSKNLLGGPSGGYTNPGTRYVEYYLVDLPPSSANPRGGSVTTNRALAMDFDTTMPDSYGGYWTSIAGADLANYATLACRLKSANNISNAVVGIRNRQGIEGKTFISPYALQPDADGWRNVRIPLTALRGLSDFSFPEVLFFSVTNKDGSGKGSIQIDDLRFEQQPASHIADFEAPFNWTLLGGEFTTSQNGAAAISASTMKDTSADTSLSNTVMRISYGGTIGQDYGANGGFSYALWRAGLNGIDARQFRHLVMRIRGERGGETPNIYLTDSVRRFPLRAKEMPAVTKEWQTVQLPLEHYTRNGIDLSHIESMETVFEWTEQSGTIYVDDIRFE